MVSGDLVDDSEPEADWACANCGHPASDHEEQEIEDAGQTQRRIYCQACDDWHDLAPAPEKPILP